MYPPIIYITVVLTSVFSGNTSTGPVPYRVDPRAITTIFPTDCQSKAVEALERTCSRVRTNDGQFQIVLGSPNEIEADIRKQLLEWKP